MNHVTQRGLGRVYQPDTRDANYRLADLLPPYPQTSGKKLWQVGQVLDQTTFPYCVGYAFRDWLDAAPIGEALSIPPSAETIYHEAQALDGDPSVHEGTSVRAGAKAIQNRGLIASYHWATSVDDIVLYLLNCAPVILGTDWFDRMFTPSKAGLISIGGQLAGGHAYLAYGVDTAKRHISIMNSWGPSWGVNGTALMTFTTLKRLLADHGEACAAIGKVMPQG